MVLGKKQVQDFLQEHIAIHFNNVPLPLIA